MKDAAPYLLSALGALTIYLMLPSGRTRPTWLMLFTGLVATAGLLVLFGTSYATASGASAGLNPMDALFCIFGGSAVMSAGMLIVQERPVYAALWFVMVILSLAGLLLLLGAQFLAAVMVIIYAGAILVTYLFVIMLAVKAGMPEYDTHAHRPLGACVTGFLMMAGFWLAHPNGAYEYIPAVRPMTAGNATATAPAPAAGFAPTADAAKPLPTAADLVRQEFVTDHTGSLGRRLFTHHVVALEAAGVLLLVSLAGAVVIAQRKIA